MEKTVSSNNSIENSSWELYIDQFALLSEAKAVTASNPDLKPNYSIGDTSYLLKEYLGFKKRRRGKEIQVDDSLEDTASSPVDFSKVSRYILHFIFFHDISHCIIFFFFVFVYSLHACHCICFKINLIF
jgi:hypothetical protein